MHKSQVLMGFHQTKPCLFANMWGQIDCKRCFELGADHTSRILAAYLVRSIKRNNPAFDHSKTRGRELINEYIYE